MTPPALNDSKGDKLQAGDRISDPAPKHEAAASKYTYAATRCPGTSSRPLRRLHFGGEAAFGFDAMCSPPAMRAFAAAVADTFAIAVRGD